MGSKKNKKQTGECKGSAADEGKQLITDPRFSSANTDPRFRRVPRRESKVAIDSRFQGVFTDKDSAPVDKRGKRKRRGSANASLKEFYRIEEEKKTKKSKKKEEESLSEEEEEEEEEEEKKLEESSEEESEKLGVKLASSSSDEESDEEAVSGDEVSEEEEEDTDEEDEADYEEDGFEVLDENIASIEEETHRLAIVNMDWRYVSAKDLYVVLNSFLPKEGRILSVTVYPTEFGLERMREEEIHGPAIGGDKKNEDDDDEEDDEDEEEINRKARDYEKSRLKYYHGVAVCDSSATADFLYKSCDGVEFERSSNKLDLRFIPDSMEFKHPPRDIASEVPSNYEGLDFQSRALQMSKVDISWDEDEPNRIKTLNQKFNPDQLAELEMKEFLASDSDESESDEDSNEGANLSKADKVKEKYRALFDSGDVDSDKEEEEDNDQDMEVTFNTGLEELSKNILKNKEKKTETVWEAYLRQRREKKKARKSKQNDDSSSPDDDDDYSIDRKAVKNDEDDDFFMKEPSRKKKEGKMKKKGVAEEEVAAEERNIANLELLLADENAGDGDGLKGYNIKRKGKRGSKEIAEDKIPEEVNDPRFAAVISDPSYALDPTDPQFKRSATYRRQLAQKQKEGPRNHEEVKATATMEKEELKSDGSKKRKLELSSTVRSLKMKMQNKDSDKKKAGNAESSSTLAQRIKKKVKDLSEK